jgi:hypothetical protein
MNLVPRWSAVALLIASVTFANAQNNDAVSTIENDVLRISLSVSDASLTVVDKRIGLEWRQQVRSGFRVTPDNVRLSPTSISATVLGRASYFVTISLTKELPYAFDLVLKIPDRQYATMPHYPFPFVAPGKGWYYVQNTSGEGLLMPLEKAGQINQPFSWSGSQPWWGLTDLKRAMTARLDTFRNPASGRRDSDERTVYAMPLRVHYAFFTEGGYMQLAKDYRSYFVSTHPQLQPLRERAQARPAVSYLKDGVYVYLWGDNPAEDLSLVTEMQAAGIQHGIAMFYGRHEVDRSLCDGIKKLGWVVGMYRMPTGNLFRVSRNRGWPNAVLTGRVTPEEVLARSNPRGWDRICGKHLLPEWIAKAKDAIREYGLQFFYFDTLVVQLAPCLDPDHPSTIEENQQARLEILKKTRDLGMVVGSGEGMAPTWALPGVDFFEGLMSLRPYTDTQLRIPAGGYETDLGNSYQEQAAITLDETRRIPLYQLAFHDYVAGTWVWRDTNYQSTPFAWKKDLFNILYGTMPMWHINRRLWESHKADYVASYTRIASVRERIGFAEMVDHGWLTSDRSVQFTDWSTGDRVVVNFGERPFERKDKEPVQGRSFAFDRIGNSAAGKLRGR